MRVLGFDAPGGRAGAWAVVGPRLYSNDLALRGVGDVVFGERESERDHYRKIADAFSRALGERTTILRTTILTLEDAEDAEDAEDIRLVLEHPFLHRIASVVGGAKMWAAERDIRWIMLNSNQARKLVLGAGGSGKAAKAVVLAAMVARFGALRIANQHRADAVLYALAGHAYLSLHRDAIDGSEA